MNFLRRRFVALPLRQKIGFLTATAAVTALAGMGFGVLLVSPEYRHLAESHLALVGGGCLAVLGLGVMLSYGMQQLISVPILELTRTGHRVVQEKNYSLRAHKVAPDEIGQLCDTLNDLLAKLEHQEKALAEVEQMLARELGERKQTEAELERLNKDLMLTSRQAGMAEVATGVLHNVGNVLNSVNVSATLVGNRLRQSRINNLAKALGLFREHRANLAGFLAHDPKGKMLPGYLETLTDHLAAEQSEMLREMDSLGKNVEHVKEIVAMQQNYARLCGVAETLQVSELVQDAIRMNLGAFGRHGITIVQEFTDVPPVTVDKHKVLQILINLMRNAKYALDELGPPEKRMVIGIAANGKGRVVITVRDNGIGIAPENLARIFSHGFTTRRDGHGFGLHSGTLAAKEMGGRLTAHSDGIGQGALFCLELPLAQPTPESNDHECSNRGAHGVVQP